MKTVAVMADEVGVRLCRGIAPTGHYCYRQHDGPGSVEPGVVHLSNRKTTRAAQAHFLRLAALSMLDGIEDDPPWRRTYRVSLRMRELSRRAHVRLPREAFNLDRAVVLAGVAGLSNEVPLRRQAFDWARR